VTTAATTATTSTMASIPTSYTWYNPLTYYVPQPDYSNNNTTARRSRSPTRDRDNNTYREQRSPANNYDRSDRRPSRSEQPAGNMEDRQNSQQDRRVYVGNLSYDVKWHHLKDHMREGTQNPSPSYSLTTSY
jgi:RNA recognition motif-containing protein